ncbi:MAG: hypothetical protein ACXAAH_17135, partial [Promethearchaeota archaeon]
MKRKTKEIEIGEAKDIYTDYESGDKPTEIKELISFLLESIQEGATHVNITGFGNQENIDYISLTPVKVSFESDGEYQKRIDKEESKKLKAYKEANE